MRAESRTWMSKEAPVRGGVHQFDRRHGNRPPAGYRSSFSPVAADCNAGTEIRLKKQAEAKEADMITAVVRGRITWRLPVSGVP